ncbi:glycosyltransferase family 2 protein [Candidatus Saccharibacteria bacterium]|nr:glycosyltransferase family 2 protein [Candidatus Saccharibacteria bacterium]
MTLALLLLIIVFELLMFTPELWKFRKIFSVISIVFSTTWLVAVIMIDFRSIWLILVITIFTFRIINLIRILKERTDPNYLHKSGVKTSIILGVILLLSLLGKMFINIDSILPVVAVLGPIGAIGVSASLVINLIKLRKNYPTSSISDKNLPTVSVCIPARNESENLEFCIRSLLANDYPKLEILVLDDCSTDQTPEIIKKFAHDGVRFVNGKKPHSDWLPKNSAYQKLAEESSGQYLLFCGVDTQLGTDTITKLITLALANHRTMVSVLPRRLTNNGVDTIIQPMRYWWELCVPRLRKSSPPVLSTCWLIKKSSLDSNGGFSACKRSILPERYFAKKLNNFGQYLFIKSSSLFNVETSKPMQDQRQTVLRVRYPQTHRRPELVLLIIMFEVIVFIIPYILFITGALHTDQLLISMSLMAIVLNTFCHVSIVALTNPANVPIALFNFPIVALTELILGIESMILYEFSNVDWKERNICLPVMRVVPKLPKV